jgi:hypothetical protein
MSPVFTQKEMVAAFYKGFSLNNFEYTLRTQPLEMKTSGTPKVRRSVESFKLKSENIEDIEKSDEFKY